MTSNASAPAGLEGQVFDIGYRHYDGPREGRRRARMAVYTDGLRIALGIGRGGRAKVLPWLFIGVSIAIGLILALIAGVADRVGGPGAAESLNLPSHSLYYGIASIVLFIFAAVVGPELLCNDRRHGTIYLYLVRPLSGVDYAAARWAAFLTIMVLVAWLPQVVLFAGLALGDPEPNIYVSNHWLDVPRFLVAGAGIAIYTTTLGLAVASFTTRRAYAAAFLIGLFILSQIMTGAVAPSVGGVAGQWIALFNLSSVPLHLNDLIFDTTSGPLEHSIVLDLPRAVRVGSLAVFTAGAGAAIWARYRRLSI